MHYYRLYRDFDTTEVAPIVDPPELRSFFREYSKKIASINVWPKILKQSKAQNPFAYELLKKAFIQEAAKEECPICFESDEPYTLSCEICFEILCVECHNTRIRNGKHCYICPNPQTHRTI